MSQTVDFVKTRFIVFIEKFEFVDFEVFQVLLVLLIIRHGQSRDWARHGYSGVYKSCVFGCFTAILTD